MILPDTSVWVEYLRARPSTRRKRGGVSPAEELDRVIQQEQALTCGPIVAELLAGARGDQRDDLAEQLRAQPWIDLKRADWLTVGHVAGKLQQEGKTTPLVDVQIAVCAVNAQAELWTRDSDFERIATILDSLRVRLFE